MLPAPVQLLVIGFDKLTLHDSIVAELKTLREQRLVCLVDVLGIHKDGQGAIWSIEHSDFFAGNGVQVEGKTLPDDGALLALLRLAGAAESSALDANERNGYGLAPQDILEITVQMPAGSDALLMLVEHRWVIPLRDALCALRGVWISSDFVSVESLRSLSLYR